MLHLPPLQWQLHLQQQGRACTHVSLSLQGGTGYTVTIKQGISWPMANVLN